MSDVITVTGNVATIPNHVVTSSGLPITTFRLASTPRRFDKNNGKWVDGETNWFTVVAFRHLAINLAKSVSTGQRIVVSGRLKVRPWSTEDKKGIVVEIEAEAAGHDLAWGTSDFTKVAIGSASATTAASGDPAPDGGGWALPPMDPDDSAVSSEPTVDSELQGATPF